MGKLKEKILRVSLKKDIDESYEIVFGEGLFKRIAKDLRREKVGSRYAIITDSNLMALGRKLNNSLKGKGLNSELFHFNAGEV